MTKSFGTVRQLEQRIEVRRGTRCWVDVEKYPRIAREHEPDLVRKLAIALAETMQALQQHVEEDAERTGESAETVCPCATSTLQKAREAVDAATNYIRQKDALSAPRKEEDNE